MPVYPDISPYFSEMIDVGQGHQIYVERVGRRGGEPVVFLHGGPGSSINTNHRRYFDPDYFDVILFDQRGCGKSLPRGETANNTLDHLVRDIHVIKMHLRIEKEWTVFGGSWGSALALAYAFEYPNEVKELVLRGVFLGSESEVSWFTDGLRRFIPEAHQKFIEGIDGNLLGTYYAWLESEEGTIAIDAAIKWADFEAAAMGIGGAPKSGDSSRRDHSSELARSRVHLHYLINNCFLEDGELLRKAEAIDKPTVIIQGGQDMICPPFTAIKLHQRMPAAELKIIPDGGHAAWGTGVADALVLEMDRIKSNTG